MTQVFFGTKGLMSEAYLDNERVAVTHVHLLPLTVSRVLSRDKDGYEAVQLSFPRGKKTIIREVPVFDAQPATSVTPLIEPGQLLSVQGVTKGKGFAGVVKRWHFAGGPRTHGQSDRQRAPGSIGQGTDPGRVHKGKKMAGRLGSLTHTVKNALVVHANPQELWLRGPVPGPQGSLLRLTITGATSIPTVTSLAGASPTPPQPSDTPSSEPVQEEHAN